MNHAPDSLRGAELGTFAHDTIVRRLPDMVRRALLENEWLPEQRTRLEVLLAEIPDARLRFLHDPGAPDERQWNRALHPYVFQDWLQAPWFLVETYFFRRVIEAMGFYQPGAGQGMDPYAWQKQQGLAAALPAVEKSAGLLCDWQEAPAGGRQAQVERLVQMLKISLWGNQVDLSLWPAGLAEKPDHADAQQGEAFLLCDESIRAAERLLAQRPGRVDILMDNAGQELALDLLLAAHLLTGSLARRVVLHLKPHPTYVSDATVSDVAAAVERFRHSPDQPVHVTGTRLEEWIAQGRLVLQPDYFWTSPFPIWELTSRLRRSLERSRLVISKGDANYRRLVGDRHWPFTTPFAQAVGDFPAPLLALRVSKSDVMVGLQPGQAASLDQQDARWMTNGRWGVMQFRDRN